MEVRGVKWTPIIAMLCITGLIAFALNKGVDGALFMSGLAIIGGLGGYEIKVIKDKKKGG